MPKTKTTRKTKLADELANDVAAPPKAKRPKADSQSKSEQALRMLRAVKSTRGDIAKALEWPSINLKPICARNGLKLKKSADGILSVAAA